MCQVFFVPRNPVTKYKGAHMLNPLCVHHYEENQDAFNSKETNEYCQIMVGKI